MDFVCTKKRKDDQGRGKRVCFKNVVHPYHRSILVPEEKPWGNSQGWWWSASVRTGKSRLRRRKDMRNHQERCDGNGLLRNA